MSGLWIYAYVVLPFILVGMGYAVLRLDTRDSID